MSVMGADGGTQAMATKIKPFTGIGSYSTGSLLLSDLIPAAFDAMDTVLRWAPDPATSARVDVLREEFDGMDDPEDDSVADDAQGIYDELTEWIGGIVPSGLIRMRMARCCPACMRRCS